MVRIELAADDSLAAMRARSRFGIAMAAMIRMIATTISNSISEKPFCFRIVGSLFLLRYQACVSTWVILHFVAHIQKVTIEQGRKPRQGLFSRVRQTLVTRPPL